MELACGELGEETGLRAGRTTRLCHPFEAYGYCDQGFHVFLATDLTVGEPCLGEEDKGLVTRWFPESQVWELIADGSFKHAPSIAALALFGRHRQQA
ncbi:NUDIX hydrolase [Streptomyces sp. G-G2]|uniref:NUDIX hydrolase n=1 Tax=Streptomyces sp. G-G2 TaxID=3046201 RepID=UPI0032D8EC4C